MIMHIVLYMYKNIYVHTYNDTICIIIFSLEITIYIKIIWQDFFFPFYIYINEKYYKYNISHNICSSCRVVLQVLIVLCETRPPGAINENPTPRFVA